MDNIVPIRITYKELIDGSYKNAYVPQDSKFPVTSHLTPCLRDALITCPGNDDDSKTFMNVFVIEGNKEIGRNICFGTRIKSGHQLYEAQTGCGFEVIEEYRHDGIGAELMLYVHYNKEYDFILAAGISQMVLPMFRRLKYNLFEVPQYYKILNSKCVLKKRFHLKGKMLNMAAWFGNCAMNLLESPTRIRTNHIKKKYVIKKETIVPKWVTDMVANDGHKYMEVHDQEWLQWNLDHNTYGYKEDIQSFYGIYDKSNNPFGFFMTKERIIKKPGINNGNIIGTVVEWESRDKSVLNEVDINLLANQTFSKNVDMVYTLACESGTAGHLKNLGYSERATFKVGVKDKKKQLEDIGDQSLWRLRYGMTNMFIL